MTKGCVACEGTPALCNNPCAVCGMTTPSKSKDDDVERVPRVLTLALNALRDDQTVTSNDCAVVVRLDLLTNVLLLGNEAAERLAALSSNKEDEVTGLKAKVRELQFLLARYGDRVRMANAADPTWQREIDEALEGRCPKCGGLHLGMAGDCMGPPLPSVPHPHAGRMMG